MAYSEAGSSHEAAQASRCEYEVVLSFRGPDTRSGFIDFLYCALVDAGVRVFIDDEELRVGVKFDPEILRAISDSRLYIPIFSRDYASSSWCLRELAHMVENVGSNSGKVILPIFFDVRPSEVRFAQYQDAFLEHEKKFPDEVKAWKEALSAAGEFKGWEWSSGGSRATLVKSVVETVLEKLKKKQKKVPRHLVGLDNQIKDLMELLDVNNSNVRLIVIYGMSGIGKTTIAKVVFNRLYSYFGRYCSFLEDIRKSSLTNGGMVQLQKKLLYDIVGLGIAEKIEDIEEGMRRIGEIVRTKKVLVVLDDVAKNHRIENLIGDYSLHPGSRVIITTRDESFLQYGRFKGDILGYEIPEMNYTLALELFCWHAFRRDSPPMAFKDLSIDIASTTGQLPLTIEVIGSFFMGNPIEIWVDTLHKLREVPYHDFRQMLLISYDSLEENEKQIFLDIACFFYNEKKTDAIYIWDSCQLDPIIGIKVLTEKCLIKVLDNGKFWMHDQLISLGKQIVYEDSLGDLKKQSRLWIAVEALEIMRTKERKDKVQALEIDGLEYSIKITNEELERLPYLRLLKLGNGTFVGDFVRYSSQLRWISCSSPHHDFKADNLHLGHLLVFKLDKNGFTDDSKVWDLIKRAQNLKVLSLTECNGITTMPNFSKCSFLERLTLKCCNRLKRIERFIEDLPSLIELEIEGCPNLAYLPEEVGALAKLERFSLRGCCGLSSDLRGIERLSRLKNLNLNLLNVPAPPELATLSHLEELTLCQLELKSLVQLPSSLWRLRNLSTLELHQCEVEAFPLDNLPGLEKLTVDGCNQLERLLIPLRLSNLCQVWVSYCHKLVEIQLVGLSKSLKSLRISACESLKRIGGSSDLKRLEELIIQRCGVLTNVEGLHGLESLKSLVIKECTSLGSLIDASHTNIPDDCLVEIVGCGDCIKQGTSSLKRDKGKILLDKLNKILEKLNEPRERAADMETSDKIYAIAAIQNVAEVDDSEEEVTGFMDIEAYDESEEKKKDEARPQAAAVENSDKNYAVAAVQKSVEDMKEEVRQQAADMETSDGNYTVAAVENIDGIDDRVKQIIDLLEMEINDEVRFIGIYGVDGIGKTTLAKAVYNCISSCFDSCSFLAEVEETTIQPLQTKLIRDILERDREDSSFDEKIDLFQDIFRELKVLIVVDDVKEQSHLYSIVGEKERPRFGPGSRIIVTSQNREILKDYDPEKACTYTVNALDDSQVFELFCKHAFRMQSSVPDYDGLANRIVNATDKLPLAVEVVGSFLRGKSIQEWEKMEKSMKQFMMKSRKTAVGLEEILDICYKELDQQQKYVFLDIASFISSVDAPIASYMWPNYPSSGCILVPLAKIGENNELQMHSLPRRLGKRILDPEGSGDPDGRKFYIQETGPKAISGEKGMENVEPLFVHFTAEDFRNMPDIRFLKLDNAKVSGNFAGAFASLRWLCWHRFPLEFDAFNFVLGELVILDLSWSKVTEYWGGWSIIKMEKLKVLNLTGCSDLLFSPDLSGCKHLEILILERCSRLVKLDPSIGRLESLVSLNLKFCSQLNGLPVELGHMTALKELFIEGTSVQRIPISIGNLKQLKILSGFKCFPLTHLPSSISYLPALSELSLDGAKITELPSSLGRLLKLRKLSLKDCRYLEELPDSIGEMRSLEELNISATNISELPNSIRNLDSLKVLRMDYSFIQAFPGEIGNLTSLEELNASWCRSLKGAIPRDIKELHNLKSLILGHSGISSLPSEISTITGLHTLDLLQCNEIEVLPELPPSLISLRVSSKRMKVIPLLKGLKELEEMCLSDEDLKERQTLSEKPTPESNVIHPLSMWFSRLWNLELFQTQRTDKRSFLISFPKLRKLDLSLSQIMELKFELTDIPRLKTLTLSGSSLKEVSALPKTLSVFKLYHSAIKEIEGLEGLKALKRLDISDCKIQNLKGIGQLTSLRSLILSDCDDLSSPDLSNLVSLKVLEIRRCKMIDQIEGLEKIASLEKLNISECPAENSKQVQNALKLVLAH